MACIGESPVDLPIGRCRAGIPYSRIGQAFLSHEIAGGSGNNTGFPESGHGAMNDNMISNDSNNPNFTQILAASTSRADQRSAMIVITRHGGGVIGA
jgi:hypothetical protein